MDKLFSYLSPYIDTSDILLPSVASLVAIFIAILGYLFYNFFSSDHIDQPVHNPQIIEQEAAVVKKSKKSKPKSKILGSQNVENQGFPFYISIYSLNLLAQI